MASIGSGFRAIGSAIEASQSAERAQERLELAQQREERLQQKQQSVRDALASVDLARGEMNIVMDLWRNMDMEIKFLEQRINKLEMESANAKYQQYQQNAQMPTSGVLSQDYMNRLY